VFDKLNFPSAPNPTHTSHGRLEEQNDRNRNATNFYKGFNLNHGSPHNEPQQQSSSSLENKTVKGQRKNRKGKQKSPENEGMEKSSGLEEASKQQQQDESTILSSILNNVLKTTAARDFRASSFNPSELNWDAEGISTMLGQLNEVRNKVSI
jgi:hypothetical protein